MFDAGVGGGGECEDLEEEALAVQNSCGPNSFPDRINKAGATPLQN